MSFHMEANKNIIEMQYAVRGPIPQRAAQMKDQGRDVIFCNIGNPQSLGQQPLTFARQVISLIEDPSKIIRERKLKKRIAGTAIVSGVDFDFIPDYVLDYAENIMANMPHGMGAYTESKGPRFIRKAIADFIDSRDGAASIPGDPENIFLTNGAGEGAKYVLDLLVASEKDGIMIPIPQYPLYSASIRKCGGVQVNYYPDEDHGWALHKDELERSYGEATAKGVRIKAIVVINPGNPTGAILDDESIADLVAFADGKGLGIIADEVYQENLYGGKFTSFAKAIGKRKIPLFSLHSASKGFIGECGHRGGYLEVRNTPKATGTDLTFTELLLKQASVNLCSNTAGQIMTYLMVAPPKEGSEPYERYLMEKNSILNVLEEKAAMFKEAFKSMDGVKCFGRVGALYLFPRLEKLPASKTDFDYCMALLEETGLCTVNGSGFGQKEGTAHLRVAFLPPVEMLQKVLPKWIEFHNKYVAS